ncbi:MAG: D-glycerate dehydrogenase [Rhodospirillaceae bacterium]|nr:D-glycerate dehydrogenase [Rhodospirillaceae bacterium]
MSAQHPVVFVTRRLPEAVEARLTRDYTPVLNADDTPFGSADLVERVVNAGAEAVLCCPTDKMTADVIAGMPNKVRALATFSVGYDHIDLEAAKAHDLIVTNTPDVLTDATADCAMLLILAAARRAWAAESMLRRGDWSNWAPTGQIGIQVTGKRLGIFGMGRIGQALAKRARGFDMEIHYSDLAQLPPELEAGATFHADPEDLLGVSDVLSLHCPLTDETRHFLDARRIALMIDGAIVVNTARGPIVDDEALIVALRTGKLAAAGLDVFDGEPKVNPGYLELENTTLFPHIGSATKETRDAMGFVALDNLDAVFGGRTPPNRVV